MRFNSAAIDPTRATHTASATNRHPMKKLLLIIGLHHSGTTIFWKSWRKNPVLRCYDEPFNPYIAAQLCSKDSKGTLDEYVALAQKDPKLFWNMFAPISPFDELLPNLTARQWLYLSFLLQHQRKVVIDEVRLAAKLNWLALNLQGAADTYVIHLVRRPKCFVTSHMVPTRKTSGFFDRIRYVIRRADCRLSFFKRSDVLPNMARDQIIGSSPASPFGILLKEAGYDVDAIYAAGAVCKYLAYWHYWYHRTRTEGQKAFGSRFRTVFYEDFARNPEHIMSCLYDWFQEVNPGLTYPDVHAPKQPYRPSDPRWTKAAKIAGFTGEEIETLL